MILKGKVSEMILKWKVIKITLKASETIMQRKVVGMIMKSSWNESEKLLKQ